MQEVVHRVADARQLLVERTRFASTAYPPAKRASRGVALALKEREDGVEDNLLRMVGQREPATGPGGAVDETGLGENGQASRHPRPLHASCVSDLIGGQSGLTAIVHLRQAAHHRDRTLRLLAVHDRSPIIAASGQRSYGVPRTARPADESPRRRLIAATPT